LFAKVPDRSQDFKIPEILEPAGRWASEADLIKAFEDARKNADSIRITNDDLRAIIFLIVPCRGRWTGISGCCSSPRLALAPPRKSRK